MDRNRNNPFANFPTIDISRTKMSINSGHKTTLNASYLVPVYLSEVLPADSCTMKVHQATRMRTPIFPVMDTAFIDVFWFYCPHRILWDNYKKFYGENETPEEWKSPVELEIPQIKAPVGGWKEETLADKFGLPLNVDMSVSHLPFRMYSMIYNEYFRNVATKSSVYINKDETTLQGKNTIDDPVTDAQLGGGFLKVARFHDMYTSSLPQPSRAGDVLLPIGNLQGELPIVGNGKTIGLTDGTNNLGMMLNSSGYNIVVNANAYNTEIEDQGGGTSNGRGDYSLGVTENPNASGMVALANIAGSSATMFQLFQAYAIQNLLYRDGINGTRYRTLIKSHFNTSIADSTAQVPEYLGGARYNINMDQVMQTSATDSVSPQGNASGFSLTSSSDVMFNKSFTEPGYLMGLICIRNVETYQQGIERHWSKKSRFEFYYPELANIGESAILNKEIYAQGTEEDEQVFGYQEAWYEYRMKPSIVTGKFRSNVEGTLDSWHYANYFDELPTLAGLNDATDENIERTIAVQSEPQFITDIIFDAEWTRPMPAYSIPGMRTFF